MEPIKKLTNHKGVKLSSIKEGQRELLREYRNKINELIERVNLLENNRIGQSQTGKEFKKAVKGLQEAYKE